MGSGDVYQTGQFVALLVRTFTFPVSGGTRVEGGTAPVMAGRRCSHSDQ
jgi:hypothetical protein